MRVSQYNRHHATGFLGLQPLDLSTGLSALDLDELRGGMTQVNMDGTRQLSTA